jgi:serine phosphatase RsbU (regulator of sigma subunit)
MKVMATLSRAGEADIVAVSMTVVRHVVHSGESILSANIKEDPRFNKSASLARLRVRSMMCVPLTKQDGKALGVIQIVTRHEGREFSEDDHELMLSLAAQASMVIENAQLHTELLERRDMERDLEFATQVQLGFLPKSRPKIAGYEFADFYEPALRVGGDYFDYTQLSDNRLAITVGDVAGKGVPAALLMARLYSTTRFQLLTAPTIADAVRGLNREMSLSGLGHRFITFLVMVLDSARHELTVVNAGHLSPLLRRVNGKVELIGRAESNLPLGILPDITYQEKTLSINPGELVLSYTDGVTEAINGNREIYGRPRLEALLAKTQASVEETITKVTEEIEAFGDKDVPGDDTCIVAFKRLDQPAR